MTEDGKIMAGVNIKKSASASKRSALARKDNLNDVLQSTRNSAALGDTAREMKFDDEVKHSEVGSTKPTPGANQENIDRNFGQSDCMDTLATTQPTQRKTTAKKGSTQMNMPLDEFIRALQQSMPQTTATMVGPMAPESLDLHNPRNYKYLPASYVQRIKIAGKQTPASVHVENLNGFKIAAAGGK